MRLETPIPAGSWTPGCNTALGMRIKPLPEPPDDLARVTDARRAIPLVPAAERECVARLMGELPLASRDQARAWLTFLRGLGYIEAGRRGYHRTNSSVPELAVAFVDGVYGGREILEILAGAEEPLQPSAVFDRFEPHIPPWERRRDSDWRATWRPRVTCRLAWLVALGLVDRTSEGYVSRQ